MEHSPVESSISGRITRVTGIGTIGISGSIMFNALLEGNVGDFLVSGAIGLVGIAFLMNPNPETDEPVQAEVMSSETEEVQ